MKLAAIAFIFPTGRLFNFSNQASALPGESREVIVLTCRKI
jgi:hypothetical protein